MRRVTTGRAQAATPRSAGDAWVRRASVALVLMLLAPSTALAQGRTPGRITGRVNGLDGRPWSEATVIVRPLAGGGGLSQFVTDRTGRFEACVEPLSRFSLLAHTRPHGGRYRITRLVEASADGHVVLVEHGERSELTLQLRGLEAWQAHKLRFVDAGVGIDLVPDPSGRVVLTPGLAADGVLVFDEHGIQVHVASLPRPDAAGVIEYRLPPPRPVELRVLDASGKPLPCALLVPCSGAMLREAMPLAGGVLRFAVPVQSSASRPPLMDLRLGVAAPRHDLAVISEPTDPVPVADDGTARLEVVLEQAAQWRGRLLLGDGRPAPKARLRQWAGQQAPLSLDVDDDGRFTTYGFVKRDSEPSAAARLAVELDASQLTPLPRSDVFPTSATAIVCWLEAPRQAPAEPIDLGDLRLDRLHALDVHVVGSDGAPARHAAVVLDDRHCPANPFLVAADDRGCIRFLVPGTEGLSLAARAGEEVGSVEVIPAASRVAELRLVPWLSVEGVIKGEDGQPQAGVWVNAILHQQLEPAGLRRLTRSRTALSDASGRFRVEALPLRGEAVLTFVAGRLSHSHPISLDGRSMHDLEIVLHPTRSR